MTTEELLSTMVFTDATANDTQSPGTLQQVFTDFDLLPVKHSKTGAARSTILARKGDKVTTIVCSPAVTELFRANIISMEHIVGFPILRANNGGTFVTLPSNGWTAVKDIVRKDFVPAPVSHNDIIAL
jgi:hypothetical protein